MSESLTRNWESNGSGAFGIFALEMELKELELCAEVVCVSN